MLNIGLYIKFTGISSDFTRCHYWRVNNFLEELCFCSFIALGVLQMGLFVFYILSVEVLEIFIWDLDMLEFNMWSRSSGCLV